MEKIKRYIRNIKLIELGLISLVILNLFYMIIFEMKVWNIVFCIFGCGLLVLGLIMYMILGEQFCWIEISKDKINLVNLKEEIVSFPKEDIVKIVYSIMSYSLYFKSDGETRIIQCPPGVRVHRNGKSHRGIWIEDFPQANFING